MPEQIIRNIKITNVIDSNSAISSEDAEELFKIIDTTLSANNKVNLDFSGIELLLSVFLNVSIGQLYSKYEYSFIDSNLSFSNLSEDDKSTLDKVINRAKQYFRDKPNFEDSAKNHFPDAE